MKRLAALALTCFIFSAGQAWAIPIIGVNDPTNNKAEWTTGTNTITVENQSNFLAVITSIGFDAFNDVTGLVSVTGTQNNGVWNFVTNQTVGGDGGGTFEFGVTTHNPGGGTPNLTGGSPNNGIAPSGTGIFTFTLAGGATTLGAVTNQFVRFQRTGDPNDPNRVTSDRGNAVPEPTTLLLLGIGLLGAGAAGRKRKAS